MARAAKPKSRPAKPPAKLTGAHRLLRYSLRFYRSHWRVLGPVMVAALLVNLLIGWGTAGEVASTYQGLWFGFVSCGLIWSIRHVGGRERPRLGQVYWTGTGPILKFLVVLSVLALASLPFLIGALVFNYLVYQAAADLTIYFL